MLNRLWEVWIAALERGIAPDQLFFDIGDTFSPYMEVSLKNLTGDPERNMERRISVNPFLSWDQVFAPLLEQKTPEYDLLTRSLADLVLHHLARVDSDSGMTKEEYCLRLVAKDLEQGVFGRQQELSFFNCGERRELAALILALYRTGKVLYCLKEAIGTFYPGSQILLGGDHCIYIYLRTGESEFHRNRLSLLLHLFLTLEYEAFIYWDVFPGVLGKEETMQTGAFIIG